MEQKPQPPLIGVERILKAIQASCRPYPADLRPGVEALLVELEAHGVGWGDLEWTGQRCHVIGGVYRGLEIVVKLEHAARRADRFHNSPLLRTAGILVVMASRLRGARTFASVIPEPVRVGGFFFGHTERNRNDEFIPFIITKRAFQGCEEVFRTVTKSWTERGVLLDDLRHIAQDLLLAVRVAQRLGLFFPEISNESVFWLEGQRPAIVDVSASIVLDPESGSPCSNANTMPTPWTRKHSSHAGLGSVAKKLEETKKRQRSWPEESPRTGGVSNKKKKGTKRTSVGFTDTQILEKFRTIQERKGGLARLSSGIFLHTDPRGLSKFHNTNSSRSKPVKPGTVASGQKRSKSSAARLHKDLTSKPQSIDRDVLKRRDAFAVGRLLLRTLIPAGETQKERERWISDAEKAASCPAEMKALLVRGKGVKQDRALNWWADFLYRLQEVEGETTAEDALLHPATTLPILAPVDEEALSSGRGVPIVSGAVLPSWACPESFPRGLRKFMPFALPELHLALEGEKGVGLKTKRKILQGDPVTWYAGQDVRGENIGDLPPSRYVLAYGYGARSLYCYGEPSRKRPVSWFIANRAGASFMNSGKPGNCQLLKRLPWYDGAGNVWILAVARRDIEPEEFLSHPYDPNAAGGVAFPSSG
jgi:hypothetical protein